MSQSEGPVQGHPAKARRTRMATEPSAAGSAASSSFVYRYRVGNIVIAIALLAAATQLFSLQVPRAESLRAQAMIGRLG